MTLYFNEIEMIFHITVLFYAVKKEKVDIIKLLLAHEKLDINFINILFQSYLQNCIETTLMKFKILFFNVIQIIYFNRIHNYYFNENIYNKMFQCL